MEKIEIELDTTMQPFSIDDLYTVYVDGEVEYECVTAEELPEIIKNILDIADI